MYLAISTNIFATLPVGKALEKITKIGIKNIEIHALHLSKIRNGGNAVVKEVKKSGLVVSSVHSPTMDPDFLGKTEPDFEQKYKDYYSPLFSIVKDLGARIFVDHLDKAGVHKKKEYHSLKENVIQNCSLLAGLAETYGITIAMENSCGDNCLYSPEQFKEVLSQVNHPNLKMNLDIGHSWCNGIDPREFITTVGKNIVNIHTMGNFKTATLLEKLKVLGYQGAIVLEYEEDRLRDAFKHSLKELEKVGLDTRDININAMPVLNRLRIPKGWNL